MQKSMSEPTTQGTGASQDRQVMACLAPAKINLFLHVTGRRPDGYHELCSLMCPVSLFDRLTLTMGTSENRLVCDHPDVPSDGENLVLKAVDLFNRTLSAETRTTPCNVSIILDKRIPAGAGLGGGSSDAATTLKALNRYHGFPISATRLHALALMLGADVPFFIDCRPALARGVGEQLTPYAGLPALWAVLVYPGFGFSTAQVFKNLTLGLTKSKKKLRNFPFINGTFSAYHHLHNDLEKGLGDRYQIIRENKNALKKMGALGALMTGSGSTVFGLFNDRRSAEKACQSMMKNDGRQVFLSELLVRGCD